MPVFHEKQFFSGVFHPQEHGRPGPMGVDSLASAGEAVCPQQEHDLHLQATVEVLFRQEHGPPARMAEEADDLHPQEHDRLLLPEEEADDLHPQEHDRLLLPEEEGSSMAEYGDVYAPLEDAGQEADIYIKERLSAVEVEGEKDLGVECLSSSSTN